MQDRGEFGKGSAVWTAADLIFTGREAEWDRMPVAIPLDQRPVIQELRSIAVVMAAHAESQEIPLGPGPGPKFAGGVWGPLEIIELIGTGAFGDVYRAREQRLDRQVALKIYHPHRLGPSLMSSDVIEEGRLLAKVRHPNVVAVHGAEHCDGRVGIWMDYIEGETLEERVLEHGPFNVVEAMAIGRDLCRALTALHEVGILHRDIKARNVMHEVGGRVILMDLGISCEMERETPVRQYGTPLYVAPEVLLAGESSRQGDIYSLGVLLFFLVSGRYPISGATLADIRSAHEAGRGDSLAAVCPDLPREFVEIVEKALSGRRFERYTTAAEMEQSLVALLAKRGGRPSVDQADRKGQSQTGDQQAQNHYLLGRSFWQHRAKGGLPKALECFQQAVARDPDFALAYLGIAQCLSLLSYWQFMRPREGFATTRSAAERALALDPGLGEAHASLGCVHMCLDWDPVAAEREFERAIQQGSRSVHTCTWYALLLSSEGRHDDALAMAQAKQELDPASLVIAIDAIVLSHAGRLDEALELFRLGLEGDPESVVHHNHMGLAYILAGDTNRAVPCLRNAFKFSGGQEAWTVGMLAMLLAQSGRDDETHQLIAHLDELGTRRYVSAFSRMVPWIGLGRDDKGVALLKEAIDERDPYLIWMRSLGDRLPWIMVPDYVDRMRSAGILG